MTNNKIALIWLTVMANSALVVFVCATITIYSSAVHPNNFVRILGLIATAIAWVALFGFRRSTKNTL